MALTASLMASMGDAHLISAIEAEADPMTQTDAERELIRRLDGWIKYEPLIEALEETGLDADDVLKIVEALHDHYCDTPSDLRAKLERADKFYDIANDAGDVISRLNALVTETL